MARKNGSNNTRSSELISKLPLLELLGENRVLVENHLGVMGYSADEIKIKISSGLWIVSGADLKFLQISQNQMVIDGKINSIVIQGR